MNDGSVVVVGFCEKAGEPLNAQASVQLIAGQGIPNDRYAEGRGTWSGTSDEKRQVTLIRAEGIEAAYAELNQTVDYLGPRRNIVVRDFDLESCLGRQIQLGSALLEIMLPCPPCERLNRLVSPGLKEQLNSAGGVYAKILKTGEVKPGDAIRYTDERPLRTLP